MSDLPVTPYAGSIGHSGSSTSEARAQRMLANGQARTYQQRTLSLAMSTGTHGITCAELQRAMEVGHGTASGCLSNLHHEGLLARISEERKGQKVYVLPEAVNGRETEAPRRNKDWKGMYEVAEANLAAQVARNEALARRIEDLEAEVARLSHLDSGRLF